MIIDYYDTSALLAKPELIENSNTIYISHFVIKELEDIKQSSNKSESIKASARKVSRILRGKMSIRTNNINYKKLSRIKKHNPWLPQNTDGDIIAEAMLLREEGDQVCFWTADYNMYLFARDVVNYINFVETEVKKEIEPWSGWGKYYPNEKNMSILYSEPTINILNAKINEYCEIFEGKELKDVLRWDGEKYCKLKYKDIRNPYLQETIRPKNLEQKMAFDMLQNENIKVKVLHSRWGGGKTLLALSYALEQVSKGRYAKIMYIRNNIVAADTNDIGFLPGTLQDKTLLWGLPLASHVGGVEALEELINEGIIEIFPLSHLRGVSAKSTILIADECENFTKNHFTLMMSRIEDDSEIIFCGDMAQVDFKLGSKYSGMTEMINSLSNDKLFGTVKLIKSERGPVPSLCDKIISPI